MIIGDLDVIGSAVPPREADTPLVVDPDRVLTFSAAAQGFELIPGRNSQIVKARRGIQNHKPVSGTVEKLGRKALRLPAIKHSFRHLIVEAPDHPCARPSYAYNKLDE
jgi:hypothetical protein